MRAQRSQRAAKTVQESRPWPRRRFRRSTVRSALSMSTATSIVGIGSVHALDGDRHAMELVVGQRLDEEDEIHLLGQGVHVDPLVLLCGRYRRCGAGNRR